jgi:hypothetical protein
MTSPLPFTKSFNLWQIDDRLNFIHRSLLEENYYTNQSGETPLRMTLIVPWVLMDIIRPLMFARNLLNREKLVKSLLVRYIWSGIFNRSLVMNMQFISEYRCRGVNEWNHQLTFNDETDILAESSTAAADLFWLFGWEPSGEAKQKIVRDFQTFLGGAFPD